jgi:hypothetical protein
MSICDIINPWGALREARWLAASQKREIEALYVKLSETERKASNAETDGLVIRVLRSKIAKLEAAIKAANGEVAK